MTPKYKNVLRKGTQINVYNLYFFSEFKSQVEILKKKKECTEEDNNRMNSFFT